MSWKNHKWHILALALVAYVLSLPILTALYPQKVLLSIDPQVVIGLVALEIGVLALAGTAMYILLRREVESRIRQEIVIPVEVDQGLTWSYMAYLEYSKTWSDYGFPSNIQDNLSDLGNARFRTMVSMAVSNAQLALDRAQSAPGFPEANRFDAINATAYHRATRYFLWGDEVDRSQAIEKGKQLEQRGSGDPQTQETIAWVKLLCYEEGTGGYNEGEKTIRSLLGRNDIARHWQHIMQKKYSRVLGIDLPSIPS